MKKYLTIAAMIGLAGGVVGCSDDLLTTVPQDRISDEIFWKTENDFTYAVNAAYRNIISGDIIYFDAVTDIGYAQAYFATGGLWARGTEVASAGWPRGFWSGFYTGISRANDVLTRLPDVTLSATATKNIEGQALFLRGYYYHELLWMFGDVPLLLKVPTVAEAMEATRTPRDQVFTQVMADLTAASEKLPNSWTGTNKGRATKGTALAYKAKAALYEASYQKYALNNATKAATLYRTAAEAAQAVMSLGVYTLYPNYRNLFINAGEGNSEIVFDYPRIKGTNGWGVFRALAAPTETGNVDNTPSRALVDMYLMKDGLPIDRSPLYDPHPIRQYANRDPRFYATVLYPTATFNNKVYNGFPPCGIADAETCSTTGDKLDLGNFYGTHTGYIWLKFLDPVDRADPTNSGLNNILLRYADVLLMYAEAKAELNEIDASVSTALNLIRARAGMPNVTLGTQAETIALIRRERTIELAGEGQHLADIRRWRTGMQVMPGKVYGVDYFQGGTMVRAVGSDTRLFTNREYLFPVPLSEIDLNPKLVQNPGF